MVQMFEPNRTYHLGDPELDLLGSREKLAQWRYHNRGPAWVKLGRKVMYHGSDLNAWVNAHRIDPQNTSAEK